MSTAAQMKKIAAPLLARHPDLAMVGRTLVLRPITHVLRGIRLDDSSGKDAFRPVFGATYLFRWREHVGFAWHQRLSRPPDVLWEVTDPRAQETLLRMIEDDTLPRLRAIVTFDDFLEFTGSLEHPLKSWRGYDFHRMIISAALGDLDEARATCARLAELVPMDPVFRREHLYITDRLCPLLAAADRPGIARLLHEWEAANVKLFKLEKLWQPTPFPIEEQMQASPQSAP